MKSITATELYRKLKSGEDILLLDVRDHPEVEICCMENALHIPSDEIPNNVEKIPGDMMTVVFCHEGMRSFMVADYLEHHFGFTEIYNLVGGIDAWAQQIDGKMTRY
jgi:adenylyltransferase/sulfurtransferase